VSRLLAVLPPWVPFAVGGVLLAGLVGGFVALKAAWKAEGAAAAAVEVEVENQKAIVAQKERDARLSTELVESQAIELASLRNRADTIITRIERVPITTGCGPVMRDASRLMRELFERGGQPPAGRQPAAAVPGSGAGR
jgi:hypothetical protein